MSDQLSTIRNLRGLATLELEVERGKDGAVVVNIRNQGVHSVSLQTLVLVRHFANGAETFAYYGDGFSDPLPVENRVLHRNQGTQAVVNAGPEVVRAQALATYIEITGLAMSELTDFDGS